MLLFVSPVHTFSSRRSNLVLSSCTSPRRRARAHSNGTLSMSIMNDLLIKGVEVGVATMVGNAAFTMQNTSKKKNEKKPKKRRSFFSREPKEEPEPERMDPSIVSTLTNELIQMANGLPEVVERGGPEGKKWVKLAICIGIDLIGSGSLGIPLLGDALDLVTAPLSAIMLQALFGNSLVTIGGLAEELLPGTDAIPTATLAWLAENYGNLNVKGNSKEEV